MRSNNELMLSMTQPDTVVNKMSGEVLSVVIDSQRNVAAVTHPDGNMVTFWSVDKRELIKVMELPKPRGIVLSLDGKFFIISYDLNTSMIMVNAEDLSVSSDSILQPTYMSGSHVYNWSKRLTEIMPADVYSQVESYEIISMLRSGVWSYVIESHHPL